MQNETKAALAIGLLIIVGFGCVLARVKGPGSPGGPQRAEATGGQFTSHALEPVADDVGSEDFRRVQPQRPRGPGRREPARDLAVRPGAPMRATAARTSTRTYTVQPRSVVLLLALTGRDLPES